MKFERTPITGTPSFDDERFSDGASHAFTHDPTVARYEHQERQAKQQNAEPFSSTAFGESDAVQSIASVLAARRAAHESATAPVDPYKRDRAKLRAPLE